MKKSQADEQGGASRNGGGSDAACAAGGGAQSSCRFRRLWPPFICAGVHSSSKLTPLPVSVAQPSRLAGLPASRPLTGRPRYLPCRLEVGVACKVGAPAGRQQGLAPAPPAAVLNLLLRPGPARAAADINLPVVHGTRVFCWQCGQELFTCGADGPSLLARRASACAGLHKPAGKLAGGALL